MSRERQVQHVWTCDACDAAETVGDEGSGLPSGWRQVAHCGPHEKLGNISARDLCGVCSSALILLVDGLLGDAGDLAQAWDDGLEAGRDRWCDAREFGEPPVNPYRKAGPS